MSSSTDETTSVQNVKRSASYVARACDSCRKRKMRCDGNRPQCGVCKERKDICQWNDKDKRKSNIEQLEDLRSRMDRFEHLLESLVHSGPSNSSSLPEYPAGPSRSGTVSLGQKDGVQPSRSIRPLPARNVSSDRPTPFPQPDLGLPVPSGTTQTPIYYSEGRVDENKGQRWERTDVSPSSTIHFGTTSIWPSKTPTGYLPVSSEESHPTSFMQGDHIEWSRNLPHFLNIDRSTHDAALNCFAAYYAPWTNVCNTVRVSGRDSTTPSRTAHYSPLLHCCVLLLGLNFLRAEYPDLVRSADSLFVQHCIPLLMVECVSPTLSSLKAYGLFSTCAHYCYFSTHPSQAGEDHQPSIGYLLSGIAIAGIHSLGLNINYDNLVEAGTITETERDMRIDAFWNVFLQDAIRAMAVNRQPMLAYPDQIPLPRVNTSIDDIPWLAPAREGSMDIPPGITVDGYRSLRSTVFHWASRLGILLRKVIDTMYSKRNGVTRNEITVLDIAQQLQQWYQQFPLHPPDATPLPHVLLLHLQYHLMVILVHRPFYRLGTPSAAAKCDEAAQSILRLSKVFDEVHNVRHAHHNLRRPDMRQATNVAYPAVNIIFAAATIFLLQCVGKPTDEAARILHMKDYDQCMSFVSRLSSTWIESARVKEVLVSLRSEYYPTVDVLSVAQPDPTTTDQFADLQQWLETQDWNELFPNQTQTMPWDDMGYV